MMKVLFAAIFLIALSSCKNSIRKEDLVGRYVFSTWGRDTLDLLPDGSYVQYILDSGKRLPNSGSWTLGETKTEIKLENFAFERSESTGAWISRIKIDDEGTKLMYASEENIYYKKID